jgi:4a-hydroxytetrahydrobiopterin dehydratase
MGRRTLLSDEDIARRLGDVPSWVRVGTAIERTWTFRDFPEALAFINRVGELAESMDHHPDIENSWNRVRLRLTTHDRGGLTALDFELARKIDAIPASSRTT